MPELFQKQIDGWSSWGKLYCDLEAFTPLCHTILEMEGLGKQPLGLLTPGTNAVFSAGKYILKIFAPQESGLNTSLDYQTELAMGHYASGIGIRVPHVIACGEIRDKYLFRYLIQDRVDGISAEKLLSLPTYSQETIIHMLAQDISRLHRSMPSKELLVVLTPSQLPEENKRWGKVPPSLVKEIIRLSKEAESLPVVPVHGDLTRDNLLLRQSEAGIEPVWIDFADSHLAPACYELPPLIFELLLGEREPVRLLCRELGYTSESFLKELVQGIALHDFGADILREYFVRRRRSEIPDTIEILNRRLREAFF